MCAHIFLLPCLLLFTSSLISGSSSAHENSKTAFSGPACNVSHEIIFPQPSIRLQSVIHVAIVGCGGKASHEITGLLWSLAEQPQREYISLHLVLDSKVYDYMINCLQLLRTLFHSIDVYHIDYVKNLPCGRDGSCFHCSTCKLFLYDILSNHVKHVLYLDTDTLVLGDLSELWQVWSNKPLEPVLFIAVREAGFAYQSRAKKQVFYGPTGINSGVLLMNLGIMRQLGITVKVLMDTNSAPLYWPDQDLLNNWCHRKYHTCAFLNCKWNIRIDYLLNDNDECKEYARSPGDGILHGNRKVFHKRSSNPQQFEMHNNNSRNLKKFCKMG